MVAYIGTSDRKECEYSEALPGGSVAIGQAAVQATAVDNIAILMGVRSLGATGQASACHDEIFPRS